MLEYSIEDSEISIYDEIGPSWLGLIGADSVKNALSQMSGHITIRLNTPGGAVDEGVAIFNLLKDYKGGVTTIVDSLAASMGSYLLQAGERRIVRSNSMVMVHDPWSISFGNAEQLRKDADVLDKYAARMVPEYASRSGLTEDEVRSIMQEETWYAGAEAVEAGFADEVQEAVAAFRGVQIAALAKICKRPLPASLLKMRDDNRTERMHELRLSAGINKRQLSIAEAKAKAAECLSKQSHSKNE